MKPHKESHLIDNCIIPNLQLTDNETRLIHNLNSKFTKILRIN